MVPVVAFTMKVSWFKGREAKQPLVTTAWPVLGFEALLEWRSGAAGNACSALLEFARGHHEIIVDYKQAWDGLHLMSDVFESGCYE